MLSSHTHSSTNLESQSCKLTPNRIYLIGKLTCQNVSVDESNKTLTSDAVIQTQVVVVLIMAAAFFVLLFVSFAMFCVPSVQVSIHSSVSGLCESVCLRT